MSSIAFGAGPLALTVTLVKDADFNQHLTRKDGTDWPVGATVTLEFTIGIVAPATTPEKVEWSASFVDSTAVWSVDAAEVNALLAKRIKSVRLWYVQGETKLLWAMGDVDKQGV